MRIVKRFLLAAFCLLALCLPALAVEQTGSITLHFNTQSGPVGDALFRAYLVAEPRPDGSFALTDAYAAYPVAFKSAETSDWSDLAETLSGYTRRDDLRCTAEGRTDENGVLSLRELPAGLYLILGERVKAYDGSVQPAASLIRVPTRTDGGWSFDVDADVKSEVKPPVGPETVLRRALKVWDDAGHVSERPAEITVQLLCDGTVYDTVILNEKNNWRCFWDELDAARSWEIVEKECPGYTVRTQKNGVTFTLTNTYVPPSTPPAEPETLPSKPSTRLPQTGQLWWPVPLMILVGMPLLLVGIRRRGRRTYLILGGLLLTAAVCLTGLNRLTDHRAGQQAAETMQRFSLTLPVSAQSAPGEEVIADYILDPSREMPEMETDGVPYVAVLEIPSLDLELPVASRWSYDTLAVAPCRYSGSVYRNDLVIAAHNYESFFGRLNAMNLGDRVIVTDMDGNRFCYTAAEIHEVSPDRVEEVTDSEWDLTLFTCTPGGAKRLCVCCEQIEE